MTTSQAFSRNISTAAQQSPQEENIMEKQAMGTAIKGKIDSNTIIVEDFNTPLTLMDKASRQKINKETQDTNDTLDQIDLIDSFRTLHPKEAEYNFFSSVHGTFSRIDHVLGHKSSLSKFKKIKIISNIFF